MRSCIPVAGELPGDDATVRPVLATHPGGEGAVRDASTRHHPQRHHLRLLQPGRHGEQVDTLQPFLE